MNLYSMSTQITIKVISSSGNFYEVLFENSKDLLTMFCNCQAGIYGKICKHKIGILAGDTSMLFDQKEISKLNQILELVKKSNYYDILRELNGIRTEIDKLQTKEKKLKAKMESAMKSGFELISK